MVVIRRTLAKQRSILTGIATSVFGKMDQDDGGITRRRARDATPWQEDGQPGYAAPLPEAYARKTFNDYMWAGEEERTQLDEASKLSPVDPMGFRGLFLAECTRLVDQRVFELRRSVEYGTDLERAVAYSIDWTKDRQENAIYAFTIVTIVFLPLSAISSIFGMNSSDVRDMDAGQWLYWVVALPSTLLIIVIGLWWMGELGNVLRWMTGRQTNRASQAGGVSGVAPQMAGATTYIVEEPSGKAEVQYDEGSTLPQPARYVMEQAAPMVQRVRRRPQAMY